MRAHTPSRSTTSCVDRAFGGRFENKYGWGDLARQGGNFRIWDLLVDKYPESRTRRSGPARPPPRTRCACRADRRPNPRLGVPRRPGPEGEMEPDVEGERVREGREPLAQLHLLPRPHGAQPRIIRDGLIQHSRGRRRTRCGTRTRRPARSREGAGPARLHEEDRDPRQVRHEAAVRPVPRRVQLQPGTDPVAGKPVSRPTSAPTTSRSRT